MSYKVPPLGYLSLSTTRLERRKSARCCAGFTKMALIFGVSHCYSIKAHSIGCTYEINVIQIAPFFFFFQRTDEYFFFFFFLLLPGFFFNERVFEELLRGRFLLLPKLV